jgi:hypothetical protein
MEYFSAEAGIDLVYIPYKRIGKYADRPNWGTNTGNL